MSLRLHIQREWSGASVGPEEAVLLTLEDDGELVLTVEAPFHGDPPPPGAPGPTWGLWEHEVVELFVLGPGERYTEIELGPHGHHLVLQLEGVRRPVPRELALEYEAEIEGDRWRGLARVPRALLPEGPHRVNAYAIHGQGEARRYLAFEPVPGDRPDFHRLERFVALPLP